MRNKPLGGRGKRRFDECWGEKRTHTHTQLDQNTFALLLPRPQFRKPPSVARSLARSPVRPSSVAFAVRVPSLSLFTVDHIIPAPCRMPPPATATAAYLIAGSALALFLSLCLCAPLQIYNRLNRSKTTDTNPLLFPTSHTPPTHTHTAKFYSFKSPRDGSER